MSLCCNCSGYYSSASHSRASTRTGAVLTSLGGTFSALDGATAAASDANDDVDSIAESLMKDDVIPPIASQTSRNSLPNLKTCMKDKEFNIQIVREKKQVCHYCTSFR